MGKGELELFAHNEKAYKAAVYLMEKTGKAAVIHPTGTGKSFIAFRLALEHPKERILWLAPGEYIYRTQLENLEKALSGGDEEKKAVLQKIMASISFLTYTRLMLNEEMMEKLQPDYIILDEFHRCGATEWGKSVRRLLDRYPAAKLLGLTATNIRYLDNQRNMAQELFDGNIASEMTLGEAIVREILPCPHYVIAMYSYQGELERLQKKIHALPDCGLIAENEKLLEKLRRALEQADGLSHVFEKHMRKKDGKYIVFCSDKEHMDEMKTHVHEWFGRIDKSPHIYTAFYNDTATGKEFAAFKEDESNHLKLLFGIDMLNEGVHIEDIDGVILLRPTVSPIIYLQQIGRALSAGGKNTPVIFDLVNNFDSLYCIDSLKKELQEAFVLFPRSNGKGESFRERFQIFDETKDSRELFCRLQKSLSSGWEIYYAAAMLWYQQHGNLKIPKSYVTEGGLTLGSWIMTQRRIRAGSVAGELSREKISRLDEIGMIWDVSSQSWREAVTELEKYYQCFGNADVKARYVSPDGFMLGKWLSNLRSKVKKKGLEQTLTKEQQQELSAFGIVWDKNNEKWEAHFAAAARYYEAHGNLQVPAKYVSEDGLALGRWLQNLKTRLAKENSQEVLSKERFERLQEVGFETEKQSVRQWQLRFELAKEYYEAHGDLNVPVSYCVEGIKLGRWISNIRVNRRKPGSSGMVLDEERIRQMDSIGMNWK